MLRPRHILLKLLTIKKKKEGGMWRQKIIADILGITEAKNKGMTS